MSARSSRVAAALVALSMPIAAASADEPAWDGTRMRVVTKGGNPPVVGRLVQRSPDQLILDTESGRGRVTVPYAQVARLQVSEGRNRGKGIWVGLLAGLVVGAGVYVATTDDCSEGGCGGRFAWMAGAGAAAGVLVGYAAAPERWRTVDRVPDVTWLDRSQRFRLAVRPASGGVAATAALSF